MIQSPALQADTPAKVERLAEIAQMAALLTDHLLNNQIMGRPVSKVGIRALLGASSLLKDYGRTVPPLLCQIVQDFGDEDPSELPKRLAEDQPDGAERLAWSLRPFRGLNDPKS